MGFTYSSIVLGAVMYTISRFILMPVLPWPQWMWGVPAWLRSGGLWQLARLVVGLSINRLDADLLCWVSVAIREGHAWKITSAVRRFFYLGTILLLRPLLSSSQFD